jgi:isopenicillin-N N-acyltransferase-like protein
VTASTTRYPEVEVAGPPRELGRQLGEAARESIRGFCAVALDRVQVTTPVSRESALAVVASTLPYVQEYAPDLLEELGGVAEGAGVTLEDLMLLQVRNQLVADDAGCTAFSVRTTELACVGQNWDNDPELDAFTIVLTRRPAGKPSSMTVTQAGLIGYIGLSSAGFGLCLNTLPAPRREKGVPGYFLVRRFLEAESLDGAVDAAEAAGCVISLNAMMQTPQGPADLEVTPHGVYVLRPESDASGNELLSHTNHCLHPELEAINGEFPELIQSHPRKQRIDTLLGVAHREESVEALKKLLSDHDNFPRSICRHTNDDSPHGFWTTVFSVIMEAEHGRLHVSRGNPCEAPYEEYRLSPS